MRSYVTLLAAMAVSVSTRAQSTAPAGHVATVAPELTAFINVTLHIDARTALPNATLVVKDGDVLFAGTGVAIPPGAVVRDLKGLHIWPALIEPYSDFGLPPSTAEERKTETKGARHWNGALRADAHAHQLLRYDAKKAGELRAQGFATVFTHRMDGIARGTSAALLLSDEVLPKAVLRPDLAAHFSLRKGSSPDGYPSAEMGAIALVRQSFYDAQWVATQQRPTETDAVLAELGAELKGRIVVEADDRNDVLRWSKILGEFQLPGIIKGAGDEYARLDAIRATGLPLLVPVVLPEAYDVEDPYDALEVSFARLKQWEMAPFNAALLDSAHVSFALTCSGRKDLKDLWKDMRKLVACGLDSARAIEAFTTDPARLFGLDDRLGALRPGMVANFLITSDHLLDPGNTIHETWVHGKRFLLDDSDEPRWGGTYDLHLGDAIWVLEVKGSPGKWEASVRRASEPDSVKVKARLERQGELVSLSFAPKDDPQALQRLSGTIHADGGLWDGQGQRPGGQWFAWSAIRQADRSVPRKSENDSTKTTVPGIPGAITFPLVGDGWMAPPVAGTVIFRHATVWTNGPQGILRNADVCVHEGKVKAVGQGLDVQVLFPGKHPPLVTELDATGKHLTCGIVDEHSHIAISRGVNEGANAISSEVRIGDVVNPDDINIYRDLAGGVTTVQLLHGSANPVGGQSALVKLRWGQAADSMLIRNAPRHIKFALGENVKQSNWPGNRFPRTRMGVEQVYYDAFHRAHEYDLRWRLWANQKPKDRGPAPRRDLQLDALAEVLNGERFVTCHSYVQSEIDMLMHVADSMGFKVNTFTHILEGYKVAARMKRHGVNASTFADWWAYKFEVYDAIPYNAALLRMHGVNTGINSDDAEMSRRLNQEAAKTVKYGGVSEEEAWKMVTLNPARMLKLDQRIGSVEPGKDADIVIWSTNPLSIQARVESTYIDGIRYYDVKEDAERRVWIAAERDRLVRAMIAAKAEGAPTRKARREQQHLWECDDIGSGEDQ
ncbi:MAG: amidohydrolase family protein [Flavobacteriales bacterium]